MNRVQKAALQLCQHMLKVITMTVLLPCPSHCDPAPAVSNTLMTAVYFRPEKEARQLEIIDIDSVLMETLYIFACTFKGMKKGSNSCFSVLISPKLAGKETSTLGKS